MPFTAALLLLVSIAFAPPSAAQRPSAAATAEVYTVSGVNVSATADSATAARDKAVAEGHVAAFRRLAERLATRADAERAPRLDAEAVAGLLRGFEVQEEKRSNVSYTATLRFLFNPEAVRRVLANAGVGFADVRARPLLVIPVWRDGERTLLWDDANPWLGAWAAVGGGDGLLPLYIPLGDFSDIRDLTAEEALAPDEAKLQAIAARYGAAGAIVMTASMRGGALQVATARYGGPAVESTLVNSFAAKPDEAPDALMQRAAVAIRAELEEAWKRDNRLQDGHEATITVAVPISGFGDWMRVRRALTGVPSVRSVDLVSMTRSAATLNLRYAGDEARLAEALSRAGLALVQGPEGWTLTGDGREARSTGPGLRP
ncbi:MAG: DUF2066 domain-containing protein [Rhodospirillales bacterium]